MLYARAQIRADPAAAESILNAAVTTDADLYTDSVAASINALCGQDQTGEVANALGEVAGALQKAAAEKNIRLEDYGLANVASYDAEPNPPTL